MLSRASKILTLFRRWRELFIFYDGTDKHLGRDVKLLTICVLTSCILEHSYAHLKFFPIVENAESWFKIHKLIVKKLVLIMGNINYLNCRKTH